MRHLYSSLLSAVTLACVSFAVVRAETVQLVNGDVLSGKVISLDATQLKLDSEALGEVTIDRAKIAAIVLSEHASAALSVPRREGDATRAATPASARAPADQQPGGVPGILNELRKSAASSTGGAITPEDVLKRFEAEGGNRQDLEELKKSLPLFAAPEVQQYFQGKVGGLLDGSVTVNDIRNEAIRARDETREAIKELGPEGEAALRPYLSILDKFIRETEPKAKPGLPPPSVPEKQP